MNYMSLKIAFEIHGVFIRVMNVTNLEVPTAARLAVPGSQFELSVSMLSAAGVSVLCST